MGPQIAPPFSAGDKGIVADDMITARSMRSPIQVAVLEARRSFNSRVDSRAHTYMGHCIASHRETLEAFIKHAREKGRTPASTWSSIGCRSSSARNRIVRPTAHDVVPHGVSLRDQTCQVMREVAIVPPLTRVTNPHVSHTSSPIAVIVTLINVVVPVVAISYAP